MFGLPVFEYYPRVFEIWIHRGRSRDRVILGSSEYDRDIVLAQNTNPERSSTPECRNARGTGTLRWHQLHAAADGTVDVLARGDSWRGGALRQCLVVGICVHDVYVYMPDNH